MVVTLVIRCKYLFYLVQCQALVLLSYPYSDWLLAPDFFLQLSRYAIVYILLLHVNQIILLLFYFSSTVCVVVDVFPRLSQLLYVSTWLFLSVTPALYCHFLVSFDDVCHRSILSCSSVKLFRVVCSTVSCSLVMLFFVIIMFVLVFRSITCGYQSFPA